ncbi:MAG: hypothetical protein K2L12_08540 [Clostridia bacterium]|nr:hypothetical protein [Clostridia bacterium]
MKKDKKATNSAGKRRGLGWLFRLIIVRIILLAAVVVGYAMPLPWKIIIPLSIGTVTIIIEALVTGAGKK